jgi:DNA-binding transcriptional LysR family regulator
LLERSPRRVRLTEVGSDYYARCRAALADLETAERDGALHRADPVGVVRVTCPSGFVRQAMARIVPSLMARFPMIHLQIRITNLAVDLIKEKVDIALRARVQLRDARPGRRPADGHLQSRAVDERIRCNHRSGLCGRGHCAPT